MKLFWSCSPSRFSYWLHLVQAVQFVTIWIGEYSEDVSDILNTFQEIRKMIGEIPILSSEQRLLDDASKDDAEEKEGVPALNSAKPRVLADGTCATETALTSASNARQEAVKVAAKPSSISNSTMRWLLPRDSADVFSVDFGRRFLHRLRPFFRSHRTRNSLR